MEEEGGGNVLFNDALNTFYLWLYGVRYMVRDHSREETCCRHIGYSFRLAARVLLYSSSHREDNTYHSLCYTSRAALVGTRNSSMGPPHEGSIWWPIAPWVNALTTELHLTPQSWTVLLWKTGSVSHWWRDTSNPGTIKSMNITLKKPPKKPQYSTRI